MQKMLYMAVSEASKCWTVAIHNWKQALNHFAIVFRDRMPEELT
jgi:transposase-like protein